MFIKVDLPAPFSPTSPRIEADRTLSDTPLSTRTAKNDFSMPRNSSNGPLVCRSLFMGLGTPTQKSIPERIHQCGEQNHAALNHPNVPLGEVQQVQAVIDELEKQHAEQGPLN